MNVLSNEQHAVLAAIEAANADVPMFDEDGMPIEYDESTESQEEIEMSVEAEATDTQDAEYQELVSLIQERLDAGTVESSARVGGVNASSFVGKVGNILFNDSELNPATCLAAANAVLNSLSVIDHSGMVWADELMDSLSSSVVSFRAAGDPGVERMDLLPAVVAFNELVRLNFVEVTDEGYQPGETLVTLLEEEPGLLRPVEAEMGFTRKFNYAPTKTGRLFRDAIEVLESTEFTIDSDMLSLSRAVLRLIDRSFTGTNKNGDQYRWNLADQDRHVLNGCTTMDPDKGYVSEFKGDRRGRMYQAYAHGPNGQSSDRSRALMKLHNTSMDYDPEVALELVLEEMEDMGDFSRLTVKQTMQQVAKTGEAEWIASQVWHEAGKSFMAAVNNSHVKKPYSFVKAMWDVQALMRHLYRGEEKPVVGTVVGYDAKCSGPQLGALMVGDQRLAAACGFSEVEGDDAYELALKDLRQLGITSLTRNDIKKPYMGVFYGQGAGAFSDRNSLSQMSSAIRECIHGSGDRINEEAAKEFHAVLSSSFGAKLAGLRSTILRMGSAGDGAPEAFSYQMPGGFVVKMDYREMYDVCGRTVDRKADVAGDAVAITSNNETLIIRGHSFKSRTRRPSEFYRTAFVNMIQAMDGLLSQLIAVHFKDLGGKHLISIFDCFRTSVAEVELLKEAIRRAYLELFGSETDTPTEHMPEGTDVLKVFTETLKAASGSEQVQMIPTISQFGQDGKRVLSGVGGVPFKELVNAFGVEGSQVGYFGK